MNARPSTKSLSTPNGALPVSGGSSGLRTGVPRTRRLLLALAIFSLVTAGLVWATPGSMFVTRQLVRSTTESRIHIKTHPNTPTDVLVQSVESEPGGFSGWHSHSGDGIVAVYSGRVAVYDGDDPTCTPRYYSEGEAFTEEAGHVHFVRSEGAVAYKALATFVLPVGVPSRIDAPNPGNCPF